MKISDIVVSWNPPVSQPAKQAPSAQLPVSVQAARNELQALAEQYDAFEKALTNPPDLEVFEDVNDGEEA